MSYTFSDAPRLGKPLNLIRIDYRSHPWSNVLAALILSLMAFAWHQWLDRLRWDPQSQIGAGIWLAVIDGVALLGFLEQLRMLWEVSAMMLGLEAHLKFTIRIPCWSRHASYHTVHHLQTVTSVLFGIYYRVDRIEDPLPDADQLIWYDNFNLSWRLLWYKTDVPRSQAAYWAGYFLLNLILQEYDEPMMWFVKICFVSGIVRIMETMILPETMLMALIPLTATCCSAFISGRF